MKMDFYSGFDALDAREYDEIMESLAMAEIQDEMAKEAHEYYVTYELERDAQRH